MNKRLLILLLGVFGISVAYTKANAAETLGAKLHVQKKPFKKSALGTQDWTR